MTSQPRILPPVWAEVVEAVLVLEDLAAGFLDMGKRVGGSPKGKGLGKEGRHRGQV